MLVYCRTVGYYLEKGIENGTWWETTITAIQRFIQEITKHFMEVSVGAVPSIPGSPEREPWFARCLLQQLFDKSYLKKETETGVATLMILDESSLAMQVKESANPLGLTTELKKCFEHQVDLTRKQSARSRGLKIWICLTANVAMMAVVSWFVSQCRSQGQAPQRLVVLSNDGRFGAGYFRQFWGWGKLPDINLTYSFL